MKILKMRFKNINSLKGEWEINFDQSPLSDAGIFAITGPNSAGKTSILDSLSLALYGRTARIKNPDEQIISKNNLDSYSEVTFSVNDSVYSSKWSISKTKGKLKPPEMILTGINGDKKVLENKVNTVKSKIADITGLDFKRFCRSVMLSQGEFAAFLNALDNERAEILEKIIGTQIFLQYSEDTIKKADQENEKLLKLKESIQDFHLEKPDNLDEHRENIENLESEFNKTEEQLFALKEQEKKFGLREQFKNEYEDIQLELAGIREKEAQKSEDFERLKKAKKASQVKSSLEQLDIHEKNAAQLLGKAGELEAEIPLQEEQLKKLEHENKANEQELEQIKAEHEKQAESIEKAIELDCNIESARNEFRDRVEQFESLEKQQNENLNLQSETRQDIMDKQVEQTRLEKWLKENESKINLDNDIPVIKDRLKQIEQTRTSQAEIQNSLNSASKNEKKAIAAQEKAEKTVNKLDKKNETLSSKINEKQAALINLFNGDSIEDIETEYQEKKEKLKAFNQLVKLGKQYNKQVLQKEKQGSKIRTELENAQSEYSHLLIDFEMEQAVRDSFEHSIIFSKYDSDRELLRANEPCPLCGSKEHPFITDGLPYDDNPRHALKAQEKKLKQINKRAKSLSATIDNLHYREQKGHEIKKEWEEICVSIACEWTIEDMDSVYQAAKALKKEVKTLGKQIKQISKIRKKISSLQGAVDKITEKISDRQMILDEKRNNASIQKNIVIKLENDMEEINKKDEEQKKDIAQYLEKYGQTFPAQAKEDELVSSLEAMKDEYLNRQKQAENLETELKELSEKSNSLPNELVQLKKQADDLEVMVRESQEKQSELENERSEFYGTGDPVFDKQVFEDKIKGFNEKQSRIAQETGEITRKLEQNREDMYQAKAEYQEVLKEVKALKNMVSAKALAAGFTGIDELRENILPQEQQQAIEQEKQETDREIMQAKARLDQVNNKLIQAKEDIIEKSPEQISLEIQDLSKQLDELGQNLRLSSEIVKDYESREREYRQRIKVIEDQGKLCDKLNTEKEYIISGNEPEMKKRIRHLMYDHLLEKTNTHLEELSGRYYVRSNGSQGLGLEIEDVQENRIRRSPKSLSGGESFLVSMALALGLADIASHNRKIESLFLDEGFGTLDEETLYKVIATLKNIKANGKMVGVISHVKKLEDEIPTQIRVEKQPGGTSRIEIMA